MASRVLFLAPVLPTDVLATAAILEQANLLELLVTRAVTTFSRRAASPVANQRTEAKWIADLIFQLNLAIGQSRTRATDRSFSYLDRFAAMRITPELGAMFGREDCCLQSFRRAKDLSITTIYQLPTAYWQKVRELMEREIAEYPNICTAAEDPYEFAEDRTTRKDEELRLADYVLCPSTFVRESLNPYPSAQVEVIPFGVDQARRNQLDSPKAIFLYAGNITMRKGVHRLLLAWKALRAYRTHELRLVGDMFLSETFINDFRGMFTHIPRLPRLELDRHYAEAAVFVFNPVADGFGHVVLEAMRSATPVIASRNSGAPDIITNRIDGVLIDYADQSQLASALDLALSNPAEMREMGKAAAKRVSEFTWKNYGDRFLAWLKPLLRHD